VDTAKKTERQVAENIDLRHNLKPGTYKHKLQNIQVSIADNGSVTFMQPAQWEIEGDQEYLEYVESQLAMPEYWEAELDEGGFFDPDKPNIGDMVKHRNGAVGKVKKIGTQGDETWVYFTDENGEMNYGQWKKHVFPVKDTAKKTESISESVQNFTGAGIPDEFAKKFLKTYNVNHDTEIESVSKPKASDFEDGDFVINVLPNGDVVAAGAYKRRAGTHWYRMVMKDGESPNNEYPNNSREAIKGMSTKGKFFKVGAHGWSAGHPGKGRGDKPTADEIRQRKDSEDALAGGADVIYGYMNKTFMPKMRAKMEKMVDDIYANLRKLDNSKRSYASPSDQERALDAAKNIEDIAERGFNRETMENFLRHLGRYSNMWGSIPRNEAELRKVLKDTPNARAKWAKTVLDVAKRNHERVKNMLYKPTMDKLTADIHTEELDEAKKKPVPTKPDLWSRAKAAAKQKYDVWPSAYASAFAAKWYKEKGGGWRMGKAKK